MTPYDVIQIQELELDCIVGLRPFERRQRQRVRLDVTLELDLSPSAHSGRISQTVDYSQAADEIAHLMRFREYRLVEMAVEEIATMLLAVHPSVERASVRLEKPEAMRGRARAAVEVTRDRAALATQSRTLNGAEAVTVLETSEATLELFDLSPYASFSPAALAYERRIGWLVRGSVSTHGGETPGHADLLHFDAPLLAGSEGAVLFCCGTKT